MHERNIYQEGAVRVGVAFLLNILINCFHHYFIFVSFVFSCLGTELKAFIDNFITLTVIFLENKLFSPHFCKAGLQVTQEVK